MAAHTVLSETALRRNTVLAMLRLFGRHFPISRGRWKVINGMLRLLRLAGPIDDRRVVTASDGRAFCVELAEKMHRSMYFLGKYEPEETALFERLVERGETVFDIGANFGWYTTLFSRLVGNTGFVHGFEPVPRTFSQLLFHVHLNGCERNVHVNRIALTDSDGETTIFVFSDLPSGHASLSTLGRTDNVAYSCQAMTLDTYAKRQGVTQLDFIKCDVEGSELSVLQGGSETIAEHQPAVVVECNHETAAAMGFVPSQALELLTSLAPYRFFHVDQGALMEVTLLSEVADGTNVLCACRDTHLRRITKLVQTDAG